MQKNEPYSHWLAYDCEDVPILNTNNLPVSAHVLSVLSRKEDVNPLYFFHKDAGINKEVNLHMFMRLGIANI